MVHEHTSTGHRAKIEGINPEVAPSGHGCFECTKQPGSMWLHLRRCAECGHIGCCDDSPNQHARHHFHDTKHPIIQSFEPGEKWFFSYATGDEVMTNEVLKAPHSHPVNQSVPFFVP